jgi:hypothetical protein
MMARTLLVAALVMVIGSVQAAQSQDHSARPWDKLCESAGAAAFDIARTRDLGVPLSTHMKTVSEIAAGSAASEDVMRAVVLEVYGKPRWTPAIARQRVEMKCMKSAPPAS